MQSFLQKWGILQAAVPSTTLNYLDRQTMAILAPTIQQEMSLDNTELGWLFAVFYYTYATQSARSRPRNDCESISRRLK